ncbi:hypothetical protein L579_1145 [Pantoea sp. AS-PWVM4]|nr:hypothetical protein L579_1145 [Pantoea sp. AS-PWVM4]
MSLKSFPGRSTQFTVSFVNKYEVTGKACFCAEAARQMGLIPLTARIIEGN